MRWYLIVVLIGILLIISSAEHLLICLLATCMSFWRNIFLGLLPLFKIVWVLASNCMNYLYVLNIKLLFVVSFANIFFHSIGCPFVLFTVLYKSL